MIFWTQFPGRDAHEEAIQRTAGRMKMRDFIVYLYQRVSGEMRWIVTALTELLQTASRRIVDWSRSVGKIITVTIFLVLIALLITLVAAYVYRFAPQVETLVCLSIGLLIIQSIDAFHDWPTYRDASKKTTQVASLCFLFGITIFGVQESYNQFLNRPRTIDRITEWRMTKELSKYRGTTFQNRGVWAFRLRRRV